MMEEFEREERRGQSPFYAILSILTLAVAVLGATFAWFSLQANNNNTITGAAARVGLSMEVTKVSLDAAGDLIPLQSNLLSNAISGDSATGNKMCVDKNGNTVCQVYKISVTNEGTTSISVKGTLTLTADTIQNLSWQVMDNANTPNATINPVSTTSLVTNDVIAANPGKNDYYLLIWLNDNNREQNDTDVGSFTGVVEFTAADGSGVTGTFTQTSSSGE